MMTLLHPRKFFDMSCIFFLETYILPWNYYIRLKGVSISKKEEIFYGNSCFAFAYSYHYKQLLSTFINLVFSKNFLYHKIGIHLLQMQYILSQSRESY